MFKTFFLGVVIFIKTHETCFVAPEVYNIEKKIIVIGGRICWVAQAASFWSSEARKSPFNFSDVQSLPSNVGLKPDLNC